MLGKLNVADDRQQAIHSIFPGVITGMALGDRRGRQKLIMLKRLSIFG
jgi:hypothetical protein